MIHHLFLDVTRNQLSLRRRKEVNQNMRRNILVRNLEVNLAKNLKQVVVVENDDKQLFARHILQDFRIKIILNYISYHFKQ